MSAPRRTVLFVAGDSSGDAHAARVAERVKAAGFGVAALGGEALRRVADRWLGDLVAHGVMGFWEPVKKVPHFWRVLHRVLRPFLAAERPSVVVPTDFFGFNRHVARAAREAGSRVAYFISPQVWASRPGRVEALRALVDRMLVLFPFEEEFYRRRGVPVTWVGHPLIDLLPFAPEAVPARVEPVIGLLPGSRPAEVRRHLPLFLRAAEILARRRPGTRFILFAAPPIGNAFYDGILGVDALRPYRLEAVRDDGYRWRAQLDLALACSGTATLENALLGVPTAVVYRTSWPTYALARALIRVKHIAMPNLLVGETLMPEFVQSAATPSALASALEAYVVDAGRRAEMRRRLLALRDLLGGPGACDRAAEAILELAR